MALYTYSIPGRDGRVSREILDERGKNFRNFATKLQNISKFVLDLAPEPVHFAGVSTTHLSPKHKDDKWIFDELNQTIKNVTHHLKKIELHLATEEIYEFVWHKFADIYIESTKLRRADAQKTLEKVLKDVLIILHPFMPFVTETIWKEVYGENEILMVEKWPETTGDEEKYTNEFKDFLLLQEIIVGVRAERNNCNLNPKEKSIAFILSRDHKELFSQNSEIIKKLANISELNFVDEIPEDENLTSIISGNYEIYLDLKRDINLEEEKDKIQKEIDFVGPFVKVLEGKLSNNNFIKNAPIELVEEERKRLEDVKEKLEKLNVQLSSLK